MPDDSNVLEVVRAHLDAFNARDVDTIVNGFLDDATFTAGDQTVVGRRGLRDLFAEAFAMPVAAQLDLRRAVVSGDTAACELVERIIFQSTVHEVDVAAFFTVRKGGLARVRVYRER